mgnify:CR=1 FL=1
MHWIDKDESDASVHYLWEGTSLLAQVHFSRGLYWHYITKKLMGKKFTVRRLEQHHSTTLAEAKARVECEVRMKALEDLA